MIFNFIIFINIMLMYVPKTSSDLLDLQLKILKEKNYNGGWHKFFNRVAKYKYKDDLKSVGTSGPRVGWVLMGKIAKRTYLNKTRRDFRGIIPHFVNIIEIAGYSGEEHIVTTPDGYMLRVHRITGALNEPKKEGKPVVVLQHGLFASSDCWIVQGPHKNLAYQFSEAGYDVWLSNARGNTYSRYHATLLPNYDAQFWHYSYHEVGLYDIPAVIDYVLEKTGQTNLIYVGHSMGTAISYIFLSMWPEYNKKMRLVISLAPVSVWNAPHPFAAQGFLNVSDNLLNMLRSFKISEIFPLLEANTVALDKLCDIRNPFHTFCTKAISFFFAAYNIHEDALRFLVKTNPAGVSRQTIEHFQYNIANGDFAMLDHGPEINLRKYGQQKPPKYPLEKITAPFALYYGLGDTLVAPGDAIELSTILRNVVAIEQVGSEKFNHIDFLFERNVKKDLNDHIFEIIRKVLGDDI